VFEEILIAVAETFATRAGHERSSSNKKAGKLSPPGLES
jgi:hypothetical protein